MEKKIEALLAYGKSCGLIEAEDVVFTRNVLLDLLQVEPEGEIEECTVDFSDREENNGAALEALLGEILEEAVKKGLIEDGQTAKDLFDTKLMLISIIFLSLLVLILTGYNLRKKFKNSSSNIVLIFSICYSIIITILSSFSVIYVGGNMPLLQMNSYLSNIFMGSGIFTTLIISFIYSYIILKIGYTLSDFE